MSKLSFRARALDTSKPMPVLRAEDVPDLPEIQINRAVPQMPTGMEKEEENEHHLQRAISVQQAFGRARDHAGDHVIPTPEVFPINDKEYDQLYPANFKTTRAYIHIQLQSFEQDHPEYDMDSEDEEWLGQMMKQNLNINETKFERMIECLEKSSGLQKVIDLSEAKSLLKDDESVVISVYDYWLNKKLNVGKSLLPIIKTEKRDGSSGNNPYIAFRRRTEKMQTRKNRKNDETSYEKMLKLKRDFTAVRELMGLVKNRESLKLNELKCAFDIYEKRYRLGDYNGQIYNEIMASRYKEQALAASNQAREKMPRIPKNDENAQSRRKRDYKKRPKHEITVPQKALHESGEFISSDDENPQDVIFQGGQINPSEEIDDNPDGQFAFKRKKDCNYHAPLDDRLYGWPWDSPDEGGLGHPQFRFNLTSLSRPRNLFLGYARRRLGRGGRLIFDRVHSPFLDDPNNLDEIKYLPHYKPQSPVHDDEDLQRIFDFNSATFSDDELSANEPVKRLKDEDLLESHQYKYHEQKLHSSTMPLSTSNNQHLRTNSVQHNSGTSQNYRYITHFVDSSDTLQGLSLKYGCKIETLKKHNKLYSDDNNYLRSRVQLLIPIEISIETGSNIDSDISSAQTSSSSLEAKDVQLSFASVNNNTVTNHNNVANNISKPSKHSQSFDQNSNISSNKLISICDPSSMDIEECFADFLIRIDSSIAKTISKNMVHQMSTKIGNNSLEEE